MIAGGSGKLLVSQNFFTRRLVDSCKGRFRQLAHESKLKNRFLGASGGA